MQISTPFFKTIPLSKSISKIPFLYDKLLKKGINKPILDKIFYKNAENYLETFDKRR